MPKNAIDLTVEDGLTLATAARLPELRRDGRGPNASTIFRWCQRGCRGVRLECVRVGGRLLTTREAVLRFIARSSANPNDGKPATDAAAHQRAERELARAGI